MPSVFDVHPDFAHLQFFDAPELVTPDGRSVPLTFQTPLRTLGLSSDATTAPTPSTAPAPSSASDNPFWDGFKGVFTGADSIGGTGNLKAELAVLVLAILFIGIAVFRLTL